jgi:hypothetical protein
MERHFHNIPHISLNVLLRQPFALWLYPHWKGPSVIGLLNSDEYFLGTGLLSVQM